MAAFRSTESDRGPEPRLAGALELEEGRTVPVTVAAASRLSLKVAFGGGARFDDGALFRALSLETPAGTVRLGPSRLTTAGAPAGFAGRLLFTADLYECRPLVEEGRLADPRGAFSNLSLVLYQREQVRPAFKEWVSGLVYDLAVYKRFFDDQDRMIEAEALDVQEAARAALIATEGRRFIEFLRAKDQELVALTRGYSKEEHERHGFYLRRMAWHVILASEIHRRTNLKPRGYAGDAEMMRLIYENAYVGHFVFNRLLHKYAVELPGAEAVRKRRRLIPRVLREVQARLADAGTAQLRFLSVASGPAWELRDVFLGPEDAARFQCSLLDQDAEALRAARRAVAAIAAERGVSISVAYFEDSVRTMLRDRRLADRIGTFHFIYSMGLFDYLTPPVAKAVLAKMYALLLPGGTLLVGNYHVASASRVYMDYWLDWPLYYRTAPDFLALAEGLGESTAAVTFDESGCQMFLRVEKPT
jgi:extracellular factor (EF) 3-hydroxypalmitic acid methyl ester biosynthesis protein